MKSIPHKVFEFLYKRFGRLTRRGVMRFLLRRFPFYIIALFILTFWGVKGFVMTFAFVLAFIMGWAFNKILSAVKDYRLTTRLDRIHFSTIEFEAMRRERDIATEALRGMIEKGGRGAKGAPKPPTPPGPQGRTQYGPDQIAELIRQHGGNEI